MNNVWIDMILGWCIVMSLLTLGACVFYLFIYSPT